MRVSRSLGTILAYFAALVVAFSSAEHPQVSTTEKLVVQTQSQFLQTLFFRQVSGCPTAKTCQNLIDLEHQRAQEKLKITLYEKIATADLCRPQKVDLDLNFIAPSTPFYCAQ